MRIVAPTPLRVLQNRTMAKKDFESMKPDPRILDDLSRVAGGALNVFSGLREQIMNDIRARFDEMADRMDLVPREDFNRLEAQVKDLQKQIAALSGKKTATAAEPKKPAAKKAAAKKPSKKPARKK